MTSEHGLNESGNETVELIDFVGSSELIKLSTREYFNQYACILLCQLRFSELILLIDINRVDLEPNIYDVLTVAVRKLFIFFLISSRKFHDSYIEVSKLKNLLEASNSEHFPAFISELERLLQTPDFEKSVEYQQYINQVLIKIKYLILSGGKFAADLNDIIYFEKNICDSLLHIKENQSSRPYTSQEKFSISSSSTELLGYDSTTSFSNTRRSNRNNNGDRQNAVRISNLKGIRFYSIKKQNLHKRLISLLLRKIKQLYPQNQLAKAFVGRSRFTVEGKDYKSCSNHYLTHLFSFQEVVNLYEKEIAGDADIIAMSFKSSVNNSKRDDKTIKWYIQNMHKIFNIQYINK